MIDGKTIGFGVVLLAMAKLYWDATQYYETRDRILNELYERYPAIWEELGKPTGWKWRPKGVSTNWPQWGFFQSEHKNAFWLERAPTVLEMYRRQFVLGRQMAFVDFPLTAATMVGFALYGALHH